MRTTILLATATILSVAATAFAVDQHDTDKRAPRKQSNVYLYENLKASTHLAELSSNDYCVTGINAALMDYSQTYDGTNGAAYTCDVHFDAKNKINGLPISGVRSVGYSAEPKIYHYNMDLGEALESKFGWFGGYELGGNGLFMVADIGVNAIYSTVSLLQDLLETPTEKQMIRLTPQFTSVDVSRQAACKVISLELFAAVCPENRNEVTASFRSQMEVLTSLNSLRAQMIPEKP